MIFVAFLALFLILWGILYAMLPAMRRGGALLTRRLARLSTWSPRIGRWSGYAQTRWERFRAYFPIALIVIAGAGITAYAGDQFIDLAEMVHAKSPVLQKI